MMMVVPMMAAKGECDPVAGPGIVARPDPPIVIIWVVIINDRTAVVIRAAIVIRPVMPVVVAVIRMATTIMVVPVVPVVCLGRSGGGQADRGDTNQNQRA
jgi:hypothetical protein